jgi:DNA polymerase-3 subunit epsilon
MSAGPSDSRFKAEAADSLNSLPVSIFDCQTTGASLGRGSLLELAWALLPQGPQDRDVQVHSFLAALPPGQTVPSRITRITGITDDMLKDAILPGELARLIAPLFRSTVPVAHFAAFEQRWIDHLVEENLRDVSPPRFICTREIARRLHPRLPRKGIRAMAGYLGFTMDEYRRAGGHVLATVRIWKELLKELKERGVTTLGQLEEFLSRPVPGTGGGFRYPLPREDRLTLPGSPGVYRFLSLRGDVLYVGKATSLKSRVNSYFTRRKGSEKLLELVSQVHRVEVEECATPLEAAMLEVSEIAGHDPPYNVALRNRGTGVSFLSEDLEREIQGAGEGAAWGPLATCSPAMLLHGLLHSINSGEPVSPSVMGFDRLPLEDGALEEGCRLFREQVAHGEKMGVKDLLSAGRGLWRTGEGPDGECGADTEGEQDEETARVPVESIDGEGVRGHLEWILVRGTRDLRRGAWFRLLGWSSIVWAPRAGAGERMVSVAAGDLLDSRWLSGKDVPFPAVPVPGRDRLRQLDGLAFRRLCVLDSEVRRITAEGALICFRLPGGRSLGPEEVASVYLQL